MMISYRKMPGTSVGRLVNLWQQEFNSAKDDKEREYANRKIREYTNELQRQESKEVEE
ncbi:hypothetical protein [Cuniculiplasma divulgatum]|uniref:Uncharacterized protein n=1 Tax=Cuniculiplasma divulgatum TaxID=1673428 RepID=A0A1R4A6Z2_9ARCH|nr:hypothetical protein [Cuniculiplasma divulgatum]MCI2413496.1 hypothetical protein [Cuniculiplasma sp.]SJK84747.1 hypothetical protein CPM_0905 [Cuniculiplasma divulgatum]